MTGQEVRFLRGLLDLTQAGLAKALGEDAEVVAGWEESDVTWPELQPKVERGAWRVSKPS